MKRIATMKPVAIMSACLLLALAGCQGALDPFARPGNYALTNASNEDIAQQVDDKGDLISGRGDDGLANGVAASSAVDKALTDGTATGLHTPTVVTISSNGNH
jgi:hypothetical protein